MKCNVMYNKIINNFSGPTKATSGRPAYSLALYQIKSAIAKLLASFWCRCTGQNPGRSSRGDSVGWWWRTCRGAGVESGKDSLKSSIFSREWKVAEKNASGG